MKNRIYTITMALLTTCMLTHAGWCSFERAWGGGARAAALGGAYVGVADTADGMFYNAAGLGQIEQVELSGTYSKLYMGLDDKSDLTNSGFGIAIPWRNRNTGNPIGTIGVGYTQYSLSSLYAESVAGVYFAGNVSDMVKGGIGVKYLGIKYGTDEYTSMNPVFAGGTAKNGVSVDVGMMMNPWKDLRIGIAARDINSPDMGLKYEDKVAPTLGLGASWAQDKGNVVGGVEVHRADTKVIGGYERLFMKNQFAVRGGIAAGTRSLLNASVGCGYKGGGIEIDYSMVYPLSGLSDTYGSHQVSFGYRFEKKKAEDVVQEKPKPAPVKIEEPKAKGEELTKDEMNAARLYNEAVGQVKAGKFAKAQDTVGESMKLDPVNALYKGMERRIGIVAKYMEKATGKTRVEGLVRRGVMKYAVGDEGQKAVDVLLYAYSLDETNYEVGSVMNAVAKDKGAVVDELLKGWNYAEQKVYMALEQFQQKKYSECIRLCEEAIELDPENATAYKRLGSAYFMLKNKGQARAAWEKAIEYSPRGAESDKLRELINQLH